MKLSTLRMPPSRHFPSRRMRSLSAFIVFSAPDDILLDPVRRLLSVKNFSEYLPVQQNSSENRYVEPNPKAILLRTKKRWRNYTARRIFRFFSHFRLEEITALVLKFLMTFFIQTTNDINYCDVAFDPFFRRNNNGSTASRPFVA